MRIQPAQAARRAGWALGQAAYLLGFWGESTACNLARGARRVWNGAAARGRAFSARFLHPVWEGLVGVGRDLAAPFVRFAHGMRSIHAYVQEEKQARGTPRALAGGLLYFHRGVRLYGHLAVRAGRYIMPLLALGLFVFTVRHTLNRSFSLAVEVNGELVGYVQSEDVLEAAKNTLQQNIVSLDRSSQWQITADYTLAVDPEELLDQETLARTLLEMSHSEIQPGAAVYVDGELVLVSDDASGLRQALEALKTTAADAAGEGSEAEFIRDVELQEGIYFTSDISDETAVQEALSNTDLFGLRTVRRAVEIREIPYETVTTRSEDYRWGSVQTVQTGQAGSAQVTVDYITENGVTTEEIVESVTLTEPVTEQIVIGSRMPAGSLVEVPGYGTLLWPVPNYKYVSRWMSAGHTGADICANAGQDILAAADGRVITAGWHYSYGNYIIIDHGNGLRTLYAHCSKLYVSYGQYVSQGDVIGAVGNTGNSFGNHCHFELYVGGVRVSARNYFPNM